MRSLFRGSEGRWLIALAVIAVLVRLVWAVQMSDRAPRFDEVEYIDLAARQPLALEKSPTHRPVDITDHIGRLQLLGGKQS